MRILSIRCKRRIAQYIKDKNSIDIDEILDLSAGGQDSGQRAEVLEALDNLRRDERMIVVLSVLQGYTTKEIAKILACPQGTVSSKLHRSLKKMRAMLE